MFSNNGQKKPVGSKKVEKSAGQQADTHDSQRTNGSTAASPISSAAAAANPISSAAAAANPISSAAGSPSSGPRTIFRKAKETGKFMSASAGEVGRSSSFSRSPRSTSSTDKAQSSDAINQKNIERAISDHILDLVNQALVDDTLTEQAFNLSTGALSASTSGLLGSSTSDVLSSGMSGSADLNDDVEDMNSKSYQKLVDYFEEFNQYERNPRALEHALRTIKDNKGNSLAHIVAKQGDELVMSLLIKYRAPLNKIVADDMTPLHIAAYNSRSNIVGVLCSLEARRLPAAPDMNAVDNKGNTAAHYAAERNDFISITHLHEAQANFTLKNHAGETALDIAKRKDHKLVALAISSTYTKPINISDPADDFIDPATSPFSPKSYGR